MSSPHTSIAEPVEMNPLRPHLPTRSVPLRRGTRRRGPEHLMSPGTERPRSPEMDASRSLETGSTRLPTPTGGTLGRTSSRTPGGRVPHQAWTEDQGLPSVVTHPPLPVMTCSTPDPETKGDPDTHTTSTPSAFHRGPGNIAGAAGRSGQDDAASLTPPRSTGAGVGRGDTRGGRDRPDLPLAPTMTSPPPRGLRLEVEGYPPGTRGGYEKRAMETLPGPAPPNSGRIPFLAVRFRTPAPRKSPTTTCGVPPLLTTWRAPALAPDPAPRLWGQPSRETRPDTPRPVLLRLAGRRSEVPHAPPWTLCPPPTPTMKAGLLASPPRTATAPLMIPRP